MRKELLEGLSEEQIAKLQNCKNHEEILAMAKEEGIELNDEQLEAVSGGCTDREGLICPHYGKIRHTIPPWNSCMVTKIDDFLRFHLFFVN